jgi:alkaline phosphatase D
MTLELTIDGSKAWEYTIVGKPVRYTGTTALGAQFVGSIGEGLKGVLESMAKLTKIFG